MIAVTPCPGVASDLSRPDSASCPLRAGAPLPRAEFDSVRRRALLEGCKWDPQVGDVPTLADFPVLLRRAAWNELKEWAEKLASETIAAELEMLARPDLLKALGLPRALFRALSGTAPLSPAAVRVMRFDFHPTVEGWRLSEVNSDVPGGFTESSFFTRLVAGSYPGTSSAGVPVDAWAAALARQAGSDGLVVLLSAPGFMEDHQIVAYLAGELQRRGCRTHLANPRQVRWQGGHAWLDASWCQAPAAVIVRFYQAEWLAALPRRHGWHHFFRAGRTPIANPGCAAVSESKRFPLVWDRLRLDLSAWQLLLPESRDPRVVPWAQNDDWLVKSAFSNTGDEVCIREFLTEKAWARVRWLARIFPGKWVAQRRFQSVPLLTPRGLMHACVGVYTVDGQAAGAYARLSPKPLIDFAAVDAALLVEHDE